MKRGFKILPGGVGLFLFLATLATAFAGIHYHSALKKWTREDRIYTIDNFEARMIWHATYLSEEFRQARRDKTWKLLDLNAQEQERNLREDQRESEKYDVFFLSIYAGSSKFPEVGKDDGRWRLLLRTDLTDHGELIQPISFERVPVTQLERDLYPYIDKWSYTYVAKFPRVIRGRDSFQLEMAGIPAKSILTWK